MASDHSNPYGNLGSNEGRVYAASQSHWLGQFNMVGRARVFGRGWKRQPGEIKEVR